ncbi:Uu.00g138350.m01.CDS01 [Anthostomella pinea]|uniref:Uu.00g138350.m01.CDS01 n=1 Tax=Anthostomella pinea TaxID=933095 RepID=A0AAI8YL76_9PEZI|nr:Uu.00g138350.m01.CDS01 [Anthostomella pinea]
MAFGLQSSRVSSACATTVASNPSQSDTDCTVITGHQMATLAQSPEDGFPLPSLKMTAFPQRPGPNGSRVIKKRPSMPRLGDGLVDLLLKVSSDNPAAVECAIGVQCSPFQNQAPSSSIEGSLEADSKVTAVEGNRHAHDAATRDYTLDTAATSTDDTDATGFVADAVVCETSFTSDEDSRLDLSSLASLDGVHLSSPNSTPPSSGQLKGSEAYQSPTWAEVYQLPPSAAVSSMPIMNHTSQHQGTFASTTQLPRSLNGPVTPTRRDIPADSTALVASLYDTVKNLMNPETKPDCARSSERPVQSPVKQSPSKPFWTGAMLLEYYEKDVITLQRCKDTAKRYGFWDVFNTLEGREKASAAAFGTLEPPVGSSQQSRAKRNVVGDVASLTTPAMLDENLVPQDIQPLFKHEVSAYDAKLRVLYEKLTSKYIGIDNSEAYHGKPVHVFIDMSNIFIGFIDSWKIAQGLPVQAFIKAPTFNFHVFHSIMKRARTMDRGVLAGSVGAAVGGLAKWPSHFLEAHQLGFKLNIFNRVQKISPLRPKRRGRSPPLAGAGMYNPTEVTLTSGDESTEDGYRPRYITKNGEQGVDENLHLYMMNSLLDCIDKPATMVLATGDAAEAEYSEGFHKYAIRALEIGWNIELVTWKKTISRAWTDAAFMDKYGQRFQIIYLDDFLEELNADLQPRIR